ncbi:hypothetical protein DL96DRAFT_1819963 [Flagelloscypha sp. PMI_526]|nr:hypothetical protein DL96DRAFT_1819963 [Flagelloscypha sp. PMI_526]
MFTSLVLPLLPIMPTVSLSLLYKSSCFFPFSKRPSFKQRAPSFPCLGTRRIKIQARTPNPHMLVLDRDYEQFPIQCLLSTSFRPTRHISHVEFIRTDLMDLGGTAFGGAEG